MKPTPEQIREELDKAEEAEAQGSRWPGMSYEQGVVAALRWVEGLLSTSPMAEDE